MYSKKIITIGTLERQGPAAGRVRLGLACQHTRCGVASHPAHKCGVASHASTQGAEWHRMPAHEVQRGIACQHTKCGMACDMCIAASGHCMPAHEVRRGVCIACQHMKCGMACACASQRRSIACQHTRCGVACASRASTQCAGGIAC